MFLCSEKKLDTILVAIHVSTGFCQRQALAIDKAPLDRGNTTVRRELKAISFFHTELFRHRPVPALPITSYLGLKQLSAFFL